MKTPILNQELWHKFYGGIRSNLLTLFQEYLKDFPSMLAQLNQASKSDTSTLSERIHRFAPSFTYVGFPCITEDCRIFGLQCKQTIDANTINEGFLQLLAKIKATEAVIKNEIENINTTKAA